MSVEQVFLQYAKEGIFLALFLYMLVWSMPQMRKEFKQDIKDMEDRHSKDIARIEKKQMEEIEKVEKKAEDRESKLMTLLQMFGDKYDILTIKVDEVLKKLEK